MGHWARSIAKIRIVYQGQSQESRWPKSIEGHVYLLSSCSHLEQAQQWRKLRKLPGFALDRMELTGWGERVLGGTPWLRWFRVSCAQWWVCGALVLPTPNLRVSHRGCHQQVCEVLRPTLPQTDRQTNQIEYSPATSYRSNFSGFWSYDTNELFLVSSSWHGT
jgi:hypothetical protein